MANKFILVYALIFFIVGYLLQTALPWYSMALLALVLGYASKFKPAQSLFLFFLTLDEVKKASHEFFGSDDPDAIGNWLFGDYTRHLRT